jgi:hypothetical protein
MGIGPTDRIAPLPGPVVHRVERDEAASDAGGRPRRDAGDQEDQRHAPHDTVELSEEALLEPEPSDDDISSVLPAQEGDGELHIDLQA